MKCASCGHAKMAHATSCAMCSCPKFSESDMPTLFAQPKPKPDGDGDDDDDDDDYRARR